VIKSLKIFFIFFWFSSFISAQSYLILQKGTSFYVSLGGQFCSDSIVVNLGASYTTEELDGTCANAVISGEGSIVLPVELISFTAKLYEKKYVLLEWETANEINNFGFDIERSEDKISWSKIAFVNGNGNSSSPKKYSYRDIKISQGNYWYRLKQINADGTYSYSNEVELLIDMLTKEYFLEQNFPNPFNPFTKFIYGLPERNNVTITIFDINGRLVDELVNSYQTAGTYEITWDGKNNEGTQVSSGTYIYRINAGNFSQVRKMILLR
jgi:hypothetical protein